MYEVKQSTALDILFFAHDINGDAVTGIADGSFTKNISKNAAAFGAMTVTITERAGGWYLLPLSSAHTDTLGVITIYLTSSAKQVNLQFRVAARITDDLATPTNITAGTITTVTNLTNLPAITANWLTAAGTAADFGTEIAAAVWQDAVAGDFTVASSIGKALYIANIAPGASGGHLISGSNAGTTTLGALTVTGATTLTGAVSGTNAANDLRINGAVAGAANGVLISGSNAGTTTFGAMTITGATTHTGNVSMAAGLNITQSSANTTALVVTGNGTGNGATITSGSGVTGDGVQMVAASTNGDGLQLTKTGTGSDLNATVTPLVLAKTTNITGFNDIAATSIVSAGAITTLSGAVVNVDLVDVLTTYTGNTVQTGDSFARIGANGAGLTAIDLPDQTMNITGNITGNLSGSVGSVTGAVGSVTGAVGSVTGAVGSVTGNVGGNVVGSVGSVTGLTTATIADKVLGRTIAGAADGGRTVTSALRTLRNKVAISAGTMTVYEEDDATPAFTAAVTTAAGDPIDSIDPNA